MIEIKHLYLVTIQTHRSGNPGVFITAILAEDESNATELAWREARREGYEYIGYPETRDFIKQLEDAQVVDWAKQILKSIGTI